MIARENLIAEEIDGEFSLVIKGSRIIEKSEMIERSAIAVALSSQSSPQILESILAKGVNSLTIKPMGGLLHLITFESLEEKQAMLESGWLDQWFIDITEVDDNIATQWRQTTICVYGVPISAWTYENFHNIGSIYGRVTSIDYSSFERAEVTLIITDCLFKIN